MVARSSTSSLLSIMAAAVLALLFALSPAAAFTTAPSRATAGLASPVSARLLPTIHPNLHPAYMPSVHPNPTTTTSLRNLLDSDSDTGGLERGKYLLALVMLLNVWTFSIPPEFRRARFCTEEDVKLYPEKHCTTFQMWREGIAEYYANGGGIEFDFSIEGK